MKLERLIILLVAALLLPASVFAAESTLPDSYSSAETAPVQDQAWWIELGDPILSELIEQGLAANPDLQAAQNRMGQARAAAWQVLAPVFPQVSVELTGREAAIEALGEQTRTALEMAGETVPDSYRNWSAYLVGRMDVDIFGKRILSHLGSRKDALASAHDRDSAAMAISTAIAQTYYGIVAGRERVEAVQTQIKANEQLLELVQLRYERGDADGLVVLQQKQQLASTATQLPRAEAVLKAYEHQLAVLLGLPPLQTPDIPIAKLPEPKTQLEMPPIGKPSDLFQNQPDLLSASTRLDAQTSRRHSAIVTFLPSLQIYGQIGQQETYIVEAVNNDVWEVGASISIPLFQGGQNIANYRAARFAEKAAQQDYRKATLVAVQQVEGALSERKSSHEQFEAFRTQYEAASLALSQSKSRYVTGLADYQAVLTALTTQQLAELNMIDARVAVIDARISLLDAVGGGWTENLTENPGGTPE
jgi:outer membrane protein, multidrug efflux system